VFGKFWCVLVLSSSAKASPEAYRVGNTE